MNSDEILRRGHIGRWRVVRLIGEGGFSWVFEVEDKNSGKRHALKALKPEAAEGEQYRRFWREAKLLAAQDDPHLVQIMMLDRDEELRLDFYVMELLTGRNLAQLIKGEGALPIQRAFEIFLGALQGLARLHALQKPIIHRDIKPPNIQITGDGRAKLLDLGIAGTQRDRSDDTVAGNEYTYTTTAMFKGTPKYSSPEQLQILELDTSSDNFSMGLCLFEALEGRHAYTDQADLPTVTYQAVLSFYARLEGSRGEILLKFQKTPQSIRPVIRKAVSLRPRDRYRTASEMHDALVRAYEGKPDSQTGRARPLRVEEPEPAQERQWWPIAAAAAGLLVAIVAVGIWLIPGEDSRQDSATTGGDEVSNEEEQEETPPPVRQGPTAEQHASREEAAGVIDEIERLRAEGSLGGEEAAPVIESRQAGDAHWMQERYADAHRSYRAAISTGNQVIVRARESIDTHAIVEHKQAAEQARELANQARADLSAASDWSGAEDLLKQAQLAESERRSGAAAQYASAKAAYDGAVAAAGKTLAEATAAEKAARASRARLPKRGDCGAVSAPAYKSVCEAGAGALADGSTALAAKNAPAALEELQEARARFEEALALVPKPEPNPPPTLALEPSGQLELEVGESVTIRADARDPEGQAVEVTYAIEVPGARRKTASGSTLRFEPDRAGDFRIVASARDSGGAVSKPVRIFARVRAPDPPQPVDPVKKTDTANARPPDQLKATLDEYATAIESKDIHALKSVWKMDSRSEDIYSKMFLRDFALAVSVTALHEEVKGNQGTLRFSQSLHAIDSQGKRLPLNEGVYVAQLLRRPDGWQIQSMQRAQ